jgi:iron-only hydrogenase group A
MENIKLKINQFEVEVPKGSTILDAAKHAGIKIPTLCHHPDLKPWASCGLCIVKLKNSPKMFRACAAEATEGMEVITHDTEIVENRKSTLELILSTHPNDCLNCGRNNSCELQDLTADFGIRSEPFPKNVRQIEPDFSTGAIVLNPEKCVYCGRCVQVCQEVQGVHALEFLSRGETTRIAPAGDVALEESPCIKCGQCSAHCPVGAIFEKDDTVKVWEGLRDDTTHNVAQIAPAVRVALGEAFGMAPGTVTTGKIYAALRRLGFNKVFDTNFGADLTIMEEGSELAERLANKDATLPMITTCCPAWVDYLEKYYPEMIPHFSSAKSPHEMVGVMTKTWYAEKNGFTRDQIFHVSIMPCTAKKYEIDRHETMFASGDKDVDVVITTRELARMIKQAGIDFVNLPDEEADDPMGEYTGAATIFGASGGVMEAALRTAYYLLTKEELEDVNFEATRGLEGVKEATVNIAGKDLKIAVAHQMGNIAKVMDEIKAAVEKGEEPPYHFVEVMACRGGCVGGGGQPYGATDEIRAARAAGLYSDDVQSAKRCSHHNESIKKIYDDYLGKPLSHKAHELLHTEYIPRPLYKK